VQPLFADAGYFEQFSGQPDLFFSLNITLQVMAIAEMSPGDQNAVRPLFVGFQDKYRIHAPGTHHPYRTDIGGVLKPGNSCQVGTRIGTPVAEKCNDFRFKLSHNIILILGYITYSRIGVRDPGGLVLS